MWTSSNILWKNITSCSTDDVIPGKIDDLTRTAKSGINIIGFLSKLPENLIFGTGCCCIAFGKNRKSFSIAYFSDMSQFCSHFKTKYIFVISMIVWFQKKNNKKNIFVCISFHFRFKLKRQYIQSNQPISRKCNILGYDNIFQRFMEKCDVK